MKTKKRHKISRKYLKSFKKRKSCKSFKNHTKTKKRSKYHLGGTIIDEAVQIKNRDNFRNMFIPNLNKLKKAINTNDTNKIDKCINDFKNGFKNQKMGINLRILATLDTFQPIDKTKYSLTDSSNIALLPCLVILYENILDTKIRKKLTEAFVKNGGNINLTSNKGNISALSDAIKLKDRSLIQLLKNKDIGASEETLTEDQVLEMNAILNKNVMDNTGVIEEPIVVEEPIISEPVIEEPSIIDTTISNIKLNIPYDLPPVTGYASDVEPEFWLPLFGNNNMFALRENIQSMIINDFNIPMDITKTTDIWSICKILQRIIPTYYVPNENKKYQLYGPLGPIFMDSPTDFKQYNIALCSSLILFGIISHKMKNQDYELIFKGGKAIQLVLSQISGIDVYESEDIDVLVMPNKSIDYNETNVKNLSAHIAYLIQWFLTITTPISIKISVLAPNPDNKKANPFIYKLSYSKQSGGFKPISDIDFREIPKSVKSFFERSVDYQFNISELEQKITFKCPDIGSLLNEKIYYYTKYMTFKNLLTNNQKITESGYENIDIEECNRILNKFKRAITNLNKGLQVNRYTDLSLPKLENKEITYLIKQFKQLGVNNNNIKIIIRDLYPERNIDFTLYK